MKGEFLSAISIKPTYTAAYTLYIPTPEEAYNRSRPACNKSNGEMSRASRGRLMNAINWMVLFSPKKFVKRKAPLKNFYFKVNFLTVTLADAQFHDDEYIKTHMLEPLLKWIRRKYNAINYVWRAETQESGNIHFHITTNKYIHKASLQQKWNNLQHKHGYLQRYFDIYGHHNPPSTDIRAVQNLKELAIYMGKYFAKDRPERTPTNLTALDKFPRPEFFGMQMMAICAGTIDAIRRPVSGKQWACSTSLTKLSININETETDFWEEKATWIELHSKEVKETDYSTIHFTRWNMDSKAPPGIALKIGQLCRRFNEGDDGIVKYDLSESEF